MDKRSLDKLERLASRVLKSEPWEFVGKAGVYLRGADSWLCDYPDRIWDKDVPKEQSVRDKEAEYVAAVHPSVILDLIEMARKSL